MKSYRELIVWQKSIELSREIYRITDGFPKSELFGLSSQMRRSAIAIPSNIAEGSRKGSRKDFRQFILIVYGSGAELETQIEVAKGLSFGAGIDFSHAEGLLEQIMRMLNVLEHKLRTSPSTHHSLQTTH